MLFVFVVLDTLHKTFKQVSRSSEGLMMKKGCGWKQKKKITAVNSSPSLKGKSFPCAGNQSETYTPLN